jgi:rsbT antagonist protein RsbS
VRKQVRIPIIELRGTLIVSIQTTLSDRVVVQLKEDITTRIAETGAGSLVIDLTGIDVMDSYISRAISDIGLIAGLMGVSTVICGMDPMVAMTLVEMDMDLISARSALNLEVAIELLERDREGDDTLVEDILVEEFEQVHEEEHR